MAFIHRLGLNKFFRLFDPVVRPIVNAGPNHRLEKCVNTWDLRDAAKLRTHQMCFGYLDSGADDEIAIARSRSAYADYECHYRVLAGNSPETLDMSTKIFGRDVKLPFFMCPTAGHRMFHTLGEKAGAAVAREKGILFGLSSLATTSVEDIGKVHPREYPKVFQLYLWKDKGLNRALLQKAREYGYDAVALTADFTWFGNRERDTRNGFSVPPNYGGRQLETAVPTIDVLPSIRAAVGKDVEIVIDGGIMRGTDIAKAIAMGADSVGVGKAYLYGLAAGGKPGVRKAIDTLHVELERAMGLLGVRTVEELKRRGPELIKKRRTSEWPPKDYVASKVVDERPAKIAIEEAA